MSLYFLTFSALRRWLYSSLVRGFFFDILDLQTLKVWIGDSNFKIGGISITIGLQPKIDIPQLSSEDLNRIQSENKLSNKQVIGVVRNMRMKFGRKVTDLYSREKMTRRNYDIAELFEFSIVHYSYK